MTRLRLLSYYRSALVPESWLGRLYRAIVERPATTDELQERFGLCWNSARGYVGKLHQVKLIQPSGLRRANRRGNNEIVWKATLPPPPPPGEDRGPGTGDHGPWTVDRGLGTKRL